LFLLLLILCSWSHIKNWSYFEIKYKVEQLIQQLELQDQELTRWLESNDSNPISIDDCIVPSDPLSTQ
jgi:hypothetical protein